jgi:hypothetical protein
MAKRRTHRPSPDRHETGVEEFPPLEQFAPLTEPQPEENPQPPSLHQMLKGMRTAYSAARADTAHTIRELEDWRAEIDATIAYLKSK